MPDDTPIRVLVISADGSVRETAATLALRHGAYVATCAETVGALRSCTSPRPPDVILIDARNPVSLSGSVSTFLDGLVGVLGPRPRVLLLGGEETPPAWREHTEVAGVVEAPWSAEKLGAALGDAVARASIRPPAPSSTRWRGTG